MARQRYAHTPRFHCPQCPVPEGPPTPSPSELAGQTCTATVGLNGSVCGRPATGVDDRGRAICGIKYWKDLPRHLGEKHADPTPAAPPTRAAEDRSSAERDPPPLAPAAQDPSNPAPASSDHAGEAGQPLTRADASELIVGALEVFTRDVLGMPATMAQGSGVAVHPVGLCEDGKCAPCRSQRRDEHLQGRRLFADELDHSIEWTGRTKAGEMLALNGSDALGEMVEGWRDAGRPEPAKQIEVVR